MDNTIIHIDSYGNKEEDKNVSVPDGKFKFFKFINKKNIKILSLIIISIIAIIICIGLGDSDESEKTEITSLGNYLTTMEYCSELESKLESVLSCIDGAGQVSVMITVDGSPELVYATDSDEKLTTNSSGSTTSSNSSSPILVNVNGGTNALILTENLPAVKGVIVVSSGAGNVAVKLNILNAVSKLLDVSTDKVSVLKGV